MKRLQQVSLKTKPEVGLQFGAVGATTAAELKAEGIFTPQLAIAQAKSFLEAAI